MISQTQVPEELSPVELSNLSFHIAPGRRFLATIAAAFVHLRLVYAKRREPRTVISVHFNFIISSFFLAYLVARAVHVLPLSWTCAWPCAEFVSGEWAMCVGDDGSSIRVTSYPAVAGGSPGSPGSPGDPGLVGLRSLLGSGFTLEWVTSRRNRSSST